jgi:hypothetical protein
MFNFLNSGSALKKKLIPLQFIGKKKDNKPIYIIFIIRKKVHFIAVINFFFFFLRPNLKAKKKFI